MTAEEETTLLKSEVSRLQTDLSKSKSNLRLFAGTACLISVIVSVHLLADASATSRVNELKALLEVPSEHQDNHQPYIPQTYSHPLELENYKLIQRLEKSDIAKRMCWAEMEKRQ